jgi:flagellar biosynthesis protein
LASQTPPERATDIAVALRYAALSPDVPRVAAAGRGAVGRRIVDLARAHGIAVRENADLAEMLRALAVDDQIPSAAFSIVAEILFHVLQADASLPAPRGFAP